MNTNNDLRGFNPHETEELVKALGFDAYRGRQVFGWVHQQQAAEWDEMTNIPRPLRQQLAASAQISPLRTVRVQEADRGHTKKYLFELEDNRRVETVLMRYSGRENRDRNTVCVSSQVGCAMGCAFCATGLGGWERNLTPGEIAGQVLEINRELRKKEPGAKVTNIVLMGMGEPLLNYDYVLKAVTLFNEPAGLNIGYRRMTLSTCGIVPGIRRLAGEGLPLVLAVSLHAAQDELRDRLMPVNRRYPLAELMTACRDYMAQTGRRITFEYALIAGVNDRPADARDLAGLVKNLTANINLIPVNPVPEQGFRRPDKAQIEDFARRLEKLGVPAVIREERGAEIQAACGQLRKRSSKHEI